MGVITLNGIDAGVISLERVAVYFERIDVLGENILPEARQTARYGVLNRADQKFAAHNHDVDVAVDLPVRFGIDL